MAITEWPMAERPREKLLQQGAQSLSDAELLAIFIRTGVRGKTAVDVGRDLINEFGGLRKILTADKKSICSASGFGPAKYALLQAALELGRRFLDEKLKRGGALTNPKQVSEYLVHRLRDQHREVFAIIYLDNRHQVIEYEELFYGTLNGATVHPREVVKSVLLHNAAAVIIAHNHPSGIAEPSQSDTAITLKLQEALQLIDVKLLDHLVIGDGEFVSLSDRGLI
ncbi:RadC family protein [Candidatus Spongiihabitans sp.]|uniref:RadC family protein n=1 Tax=Candidatus Spongiihabitans sp. TaxID=3101308 RepID=UPI003C6FFE49